MKVHLQAKHDMRQRKAGDHVTTMGKRKNVDEKKKDDAKNHQDSPHTALALWSGTNKNIDVSTGPLAGPFTRSLARSLPRSWERELLMSQNDLVLSLSGMVC